MKLLQTTGLVLAAAFIMVACGKSGDSVETTDAQEVAEAAGTTLMIDNQSSKVNWKGYKSSGQHYGFIPVTTGELVVAGEEITGGKFVFSIPDLKIEDLAEGSEDYGKLHGHLQSPDFFDAANHPEAIFEVTEVSAYTADNAVADKDEFVTDNTPSKNTELAGDNPTHWISGNLTMRGTTKNIKFPATVSMTDGGVTAKAGFNIDRTSWGLSYGDESSTLDKVKDQFIYNTVSVLFDINAK